MIRMAYIYTTLRDVTIAMATGRSPKAGERLARWVSEHRAKRERSRAATLASGHDLGLLGLPESARLD